MNLMSWEEDMGEYCLALWKISLTGLRRGSLTHEEASGTAYSQTSGWWSVPEVERAVPDSTHHPDRHQSSREDIVDHASHGRRIPDHQKNAAHQEIASEMLEKTASPSHGLSSNQEVSDSEWPPSLSWRRDTLSRSIKFTCPVEH